MGGRGSLSASSIASAVSRYEIITGNANVARLRRNGATGRDIAKIAAAYRENRMSGMKKRDARIAAEKSFTKTTRRKQPSSGGLRRPNDMSLSEFKNFTKNGGITTQSALDKAWAFTKRQRSRPQKSGVNSFGEATRRVITTSTYERAMKRTEKAALRNMGY